MSDYKARLVRDFENSLLPHFDAEDIDTISNLLMIALADYRIDREVREIAILDDYNERVLNTYLNCISIEGKSKETIKQYRRELRRLADVLRKNYNDMGTFDLRYYLAVLKSRNVTNTTLENSRSYMSSFFRWMEVEGFVEKNPMAAIKPIKHNPKEDTPFLSSEIDALRFACANLKERAIIEVALSSGLRCAELANLKISDVDLKTFEVRVRNGKGNKDRISYINELTAKCLEKYLCDRHDSFDTLFLSRVNGGSPYTKSGIYSTIRKVGRRAKVDGVHPHRFRHTMASELAKKGMPLQEIQALLGHSNINTTMRYVHINQTVVGASYKKFSG